MKKEYNGLTIKCDENIEEELFEVFFEGVINELKKIKDWFEVEYDSLVLSIVSKENMNKIVKNKSVQYKNIDVPDWLVGFSNVEEVWVVVPNRENLDELCKVALHELVHLLSYKLDISQRRLKLLDEGIAVYLSNQYEGKIYTPWVNAYLKNKLPKVSDFCVYDGMKFAETGGYRYCHLIIEFLLEHYGKDMFLNWLQKPTEFEKHLEKINTLYDEYIKIKIEARIK